MFAKVIIKDEVLIEKLWHNQGFDFQSLDIVTVEGGGGKIISLTLGGNRSVEVNDVILNHCSENKIPYTYDQGVIDGRKQVQEDLDASQKHIVELQNKLIKVREAMDA